MAPIAVWNISDSFCRVKSEFECFFIAAKPGATSFLFWAANVFVVCLSRRGVYVRALFASRYVFGVVKVT